jgi:ankyrin repeat protein
MCCQLSLGGLHFSGASHVFSEPVLSALEHTAEFDTDPDRRIEASSILWRMYLAPDEFGIEQNVEKGLLFLTKSAEAGHQEDQALVLRLHRVFGRDVPRNLHSLQAQWLTEAAATGSLTAMEDLAHFRFEAELEDAKARLKGRYCGIGEEVFEFEDEASQALRDPFSDLGRSYLGAELEAGRNLGQDLRGYFLRLSATYGSVDAVVYLVEELGTEVDDANSFNDRALLLAARSGRKDVLLMLLRLGADPRLGDRGGDTPLHWLCSFDDDDVEEAAEALIQHHADIDAQADKFPVSGQLQYAETEFVAGTPLHRAICRGKLQAVRTLLRFGAGLESPALNAIDNTPLALAALLHYPDILSECLSNHRATGSREKSITSGGQSLLIPAMEGGSLHKVTIGRLIRHGEQWKKRAVDTLALLCTPGTMSHLDDLPGQPGCSALFFAARCPPHVLEFIHHASAIYINRRSKRFNNNEEFDLDPTIQHPPLHEAILHGKPLNALKLLELGADATQGETGTSPTSALYQCVLASVEDLVLAEELCRRGLRVDDGPLDYETPFMFAVRNGCYKLASFLRHQGANVNALCSRGYMWTSHTRHTLLLLLLRNNRATSLSGLNFLLDQSTHTAGNATVDIIVDPERNYTAFHAIAMLNGDSIDSDTATKALAQCERYFAPGPAILDIGSYPRSSSDKTDARVVHDAGGNTALHYAAIYANFEAIDFLLNHGANADLVNAMGMTALDIAELSYPDFETRFVPRDVPQSPSRQLEAARRRRLYIRRRLTNATTEGVNLALLERVVLDDESLDGLKRDEYKEKL